MDTEGAIENVHINGVSVLNRWNLEKCKGFLYPGTKQTVCNKWGVHIKLVFVKQGFTVTLLSHVKVGAKHLYVNLFGSTDH